MKRASSSKTHYPPLALFALCVLLSGGVNQHAQTRPPQHVATGADDVIFSVRFSPDSRTLAIARGASDISQRYGRVELWDVATGTLRQLIKGFDGPVWSISFAPDGKTLVTGSSEFHETKIQAKAMRREGKLSAELKWWDPQTGELKQQLALPGDDRIGVLAAYSPDGKTLATVEYYGQRPTAPVKSTGSLDPLWAPVDRGGNPTGEYKRPADADTVLGRSGWGRAIYDSDLKLLDARTGDLRIKVKRGLGSYRIPFFVGPHPPPDLRGLFSLGLTAQRREPAIFSPDGQLVAVWNADEITLWNSATGEEVRKLKKFNGELSATAFSPDSRTLATAVTKLSSKGNRVVFKSEVGLYDLATGALTQTLSVRTEAISSLAFSLNGRQLLIGGLRLNEEKPIETLELSDIQTGSLGSVHTGNEGSVRSLALSPNGRVLALQSDAATVELLDTLTWKIARTFDEKSDGDASPRPVSRFVLSVKRVLSLAFTADGNTISGEIEQDGIKQWDIRTGGVKKQIDEREDPAALVDVSANGNDAAEITGDETVRLWDVATGSKTIIPNGGGSISAIALSRNGHALAIAYPKQIVILNPATREPMRTLQGRTSNIDSMTFSVDGETLAAAGESGAIEIWALESGQITKTITSTGKVTALCFSPDGRTIASASADGAVNLWDSRTGALVLQLKKHSATVNAIAFSGKGNLIATGGDDRTVIIWETATGKSQRTLKGHEMTVTSLAFSPDASLLASGCGNASVVLWDVRTGDLNRVLR